MSDRLIGRREYRVVQFFVRGEYESHRDLRDDVRATGRFQQLVNPDFGEIRLIWASDFQPDGFSTIHVDTDAESTSEPIYLVSVRAES